MDNEQAVVLSEKDSKTQKNDSMVLPRTSVDRIQESLHTATTNLKLDVVSRLLSAVETSREVLKAIDPQKIYIARIPKKFLADMEQGLVDFMKDSKTGENFGDLVDLKHKVCGKVWIREAVLVDFSQLALNIASLAIQQQLAEMTAVLDDIRSRVIAIQEGMDHALFGKLKGMRDQLLLVNEMQDSQARTQLITQAITTLNATRGEIETALIDAIEEMKDVPDNDFKIACRIIADKSFLTDVNKSYNRIEELFSYYITASQLLGYAFAYLGERRTLDMVFEIKDQLLHNNGLKKLESAERLYTLPIGETWYKNPEHYLQGIQDKVKEIFAQKDYVEIEVTGKALLEAANEGE